MAITYPLSMPAAPFKFRAFNVIQNFQVAVNKSPFTGQGQTYEHPGSWWSAKIDFPPLTRVQAGPWIGFLAALNGRSGTFLLGPPNWATPLGTAGGSPIVNGASQTGKTLAISGLTGVLKAGDYFQVGSGLTQRLYMNLTDAGPGTVTLDIFPRLRESPANSAPLTLVNPQGCFRLDSNQNSWAIGVDKNYGLSFSAEEAF
jgi:hypothetical protein